MYLGKGVKCRYICCFFDTDPYQVCSNCRERIAIMMILMMNALVGWLEESWLNPFSAKPIFGRKKFFLGNFRATLVFMLERKILRKFFLVN